MIGLMRCLVAGMVLVVSSSVVTAALPEGPLERFDLDRGQLVWEKADPGRGHVEALGEQAGIWGTADGVHEAWAYPFKLVSDLTIEFSTDAGKTFVTSGQLVRRQVATPHMAIHHRGPQEQRVPHPILHSQTAAEDHRRQSPRCWRWKCASSLNKPTRRPQNLQQFRPMAGNSAVEFSTVKS